MSSNTPPQDGEVISHIVDLSEPTNDQAPPQADAPKPSVLQDKFGGDVGKLEQSYAELQQKFGQQSAQQPPTSEAKDVPQMGQQKEAAPPQADFEAMTKQYIADGELSAENRAALEGMGIPEPMIQQHIAGIEAQRQMAVQEINSIAGGEEELNRMVQWGSVNLSEAEQNVFNSQMASGDMGQVQYAMNNLKARYSGSPAGQDIVEGAPGLAYTGPGQGAYASKQEFLADLGSEDYQKGDAAAQQRVEARMAATMQINPDLL